MASYSSSRSRRWPVPSKWRSISRSSCGRSGTDRLIWHTEGRSDEDKATIQEIDSFQGRLMPSYPIHASFRFQLPPQPWSFAGHYISIIWAIEVNVDVPMATDLRHCERLVMLPNAAR